MSRIPSFVRRYQLAVYFVLVYAVSWAVWGTEIAEAHRRIGWQIPEVFAFLSMTLVAFVVAALAGGRAALKEWGSRFVRWRAGIGWYAFVLLLTPALSLVAIGVHLLLGGTHQFAVLAPLSAVVPIFLSQILTHLLTEEAGWRGFALPRLQERFAPLTASLLLGMVWAGWHLPLFLLPGSSQTFPFAGFLIQVVATTIIMTWVFNHTNGSVLMAALYHAAMNTSLVVFNTLWGDLRVFWLYTALTALVAAGVVRVEGSRFRSHQPAATWLGATHHRTEQAHVTHAG